MPPKHTWKKLLQRASDVLQKGHMHEALQLCDKAALQNEQGRYHAALLRGRILLQFGDAKGALSSYESVADPEVYDALLDYERGLVLFELLRFSEAEHALLSALRGDSHHIHILYTLALMAELQDSGLEVEYFRKLRKLDPQRFANAFKLSEEEFAKVIEAALESLPSKLMQAMVDIPVLVAQLPRLEDLAQVDPPLSPRILGTQVILEEGKSQGHSPYKPMQTAILLFKRNLERAASNQEALLTLIQQIILREANDLFDISSYDSDNDSGYETLN